MIKWKPNVGDGVYVCQDGKWGRREEATIREVRGFALLIRYKPWDETRYVEEWFVRSKGRSPNTYARNRHPEGMFGYYLAVPLDWADDKWRGE